MLTVSYLLYNQRLFMMCFAIGASVVIGILSSDAFRR